MDLDLDSDSDAEIGLLEEELLPQQREQRQFNPRLFDENVSDIVYRQRYRVPQPVIDDLEQRLRQYLKHPTERNHALTVRQQILLFLQFLGSNGFYHLLRDAQGPSTNTVCRIVHRVSEAMVKLQEAEICWPEDCSNLATEFFKIGKFPQVGGTLDGTHVKVTPPKKDEPACLNRHHEHSLNVLLVCGPNLEFFYANANFPGRCHDARVLRESSLWTEFEDRGWRPFDGCVILADSAYPLQDWLITLFPGDPEGAKARFNAAHIRTRNTVERAIGVLKKRFYALSTGLRVASLKTASRIILSAVILHNLAIRFGDQGADLDDGEGLDEQPGNQQGQPAEEAGDQMPADGDRNRRRNQLLQCFTRD